MLAAALEREGWSVWWDLKIPPGKTFNGVTRKALDKDGAFGVVVKNLCQIRVKTLPIRSQFLRCRVVRNLQGATQRPHDSTLANDRMIRLASLRFR
jgi:hypothetical protein